MSRGSIQSFSIENGIPLSEAIGIFGRRTEGLVSGIKVVLEKPELLTPGLFSQAIFYALHLPQVPKAGEIAFDGSEPKQVDQDFAADFGYQIKQIGCAKKVQAELSEASIGPILIHRDHPLTHASFGHLHVEYSSLDPQDAYYMRFIVPNKPSALADLLSPIADQGISIRTMMQKETSEDESIAQVALLFHPCKAEQIHVAAKDVLAKQGCLKIGAIYRVIDYPALDLNEKPQ